MRIPKSEKRAKIPMASRLFPRPSRGNKTCLRRIRTHLAARITSTRQKVRYLVNLHSRRTEIPRRMDEGIQPVSVHPLHLDGGFEQRVYLQPIHSPYSSEWGTSPRSSRRTPGCRERGKTGDSTSPRWRSTCKSTLYTTINTPSVQ